MVFLYKKEGKIKICIFAYDCVKKFWKKKPQINVVTYGGAKIGGRLFPFMLF